jgi:magnesium transporter
MAERDENDGTVRGPLWAAPLRRVVARVVNPHDHPDTPPEPHVHRVSVVDCAVYLDGVRQAGEPGHYAEALHRAEHQDGAFVWLGLHGPDEEAMADVAAVFGLHELAVEDALTATHRPKIEQYADVTFFVLRTSRYVEHPELTDTSEVVETGAIMMFIGPRFVITVRHGTPGALGKVRADLEANPTMLARGPWAVAHAVCDRLVDSYVEVAAAVEADVDRLEEHVFAPQSQGRIAHIYQLKRELMEFKRAVAPLQRPLAAIVENRQLVPKEIRRYFRDVNDNLLRVVEQIVGFDDLVNSILQARLAQVTVDQNNDMRKIAAWAGIAAVQTAIVGIYGMNFDFMPELRMRYGYPVVLLTMLVAAVVLYRVFRRSGWL